MVRIVFLFQCTATPEIINGKCSDTENNTQTILDYQKSYGVTGMTYPCFYHTVHDGVVLRVDGISQTNPINTILLPFLALVLIIAGMIYTFNTRCAKFPCGKRKNP